MSIISATAIEVVTGDTWTFPVTVDEDLTGYTITGEIEYGATEVALTIGNGGVTAFVPGALESTFNLVVVPATTNLISEGTPTKIIARMTLAGAITTILSVPLTVLEP